MESLFGRYKNALVLMLVLLAQVVLLAMQVRRPAPGMPEGHNVRLWRSLVTSVVAPPENLAHNIGKGVRNLWSNYIYLHDLRQQNLSLKQENDRLRLEQASLAQDAQAGQRLRELLDFRGRYIDKTVAAQVIGTSGTDQARDIFIDKGFKDGLQVQMPVITPYGIVGKIKNVFAHSAQVLLISDQTSGTGVLLENTRVRGVMKGDPSGEPQIVNISPDDRIKPGEPVMTSGGDEVYPPGMPVGVVDRVVPDPDSSYVNVVIKPNSDLGALEEVLVVIQFSDKMPFAQEKDINQSEAVALAAKQRAADILSEKLPSLRDPNAPETTLGANTETSATTGGEGDPARPMRPPQPLHPDRYTPGAAPPATDLTPGAAPPVTHRMPSTEASAPSTNPGSKSNPSSAPPVYAGGDSGPVNRFPARLGVVTPKPAVATTDAGAATGTSKPGTALSATTTSSPAKTLGSTATSAGAGTVQPHSPIPSSRPATPSSASVDESAATATPVRRTPTPADADSGGILTPAGMGSVGTTARPRTTPPAGSTTAPGVSGPANSPTAKPAAPKAPTSKTPTPSGSQTAPAPAQSSPQPATTPPGGE
jgi:rod shape-determining protein MreC